MPWRKWGSDVMREHSMKNTIISGLLTFWTDVRMSVCVCDTQSTPKTAGSSYLLLCNNIPKFSSLKYQHLYCLWISSLGQTQWGQLISVLLTIRVSGERSKASPGAIWRRSHLHMHRLTLAICWDLSWDCGWNTWPFLPGGCLASSCPEGWVLSANILREREPGRSCIAFYEQTFEVLQNHFCCVLLIGGSWDDAYSRELK